MDRLRRDANVDMLGSWEWLEAITQIISLHNLWPNPPGDEDPTQ